VYPFRKDFQGLVDTIKHVLTAVGNGSSDYSVLAEDIATYERQLAMVSIHINQIPLTMMILGIIN